MNLIAPSSGASSAAQMRRMRRKLGTLRASNYDISSQCNLTCEGCLFFAREDGVALDKGNDADWEERFRLEGERGVNFAYLAGAEPSMHPERLRSAWRYIKGGVIFTNGTRKIDPEIGYRIHVSLWGLGDKAAKLRGGDSTSKALRLFGTDPRAVFVLTVNPENIEQIVPIAAACAEAGVTKLTFSYFSPTLAYQSGESGEDVSDYMRLDEDIRMTPADFARARREIATAHQLFPQTVVYSFEYDDWVSKPSDQLYQYDETGIAIDCGNRLTEFHKHFTHDGQVSAGKCCSPNIDCRECRAYAMAMGTYVSRKQTDPAMRAAQLRVMQVWYDLFMPLADTAD